MWIGVSGGLIGRPFDSVCVQVREESRRQGAALDEMRARVELRRARVGELLVARRDAARGVDRRREQLQAQIDRVLRLSGAVAAASRRLQVIDTNAACIEN